MKLIFEWLRYMILRFYYRRLYRRIYFILKGRIEKPFEALSLSSKHFRLITGRDWQEFRRPVSFQDFIKLRHKEGLSVC